MARRCFTGPAYFGRATGYSDIGGSEGGSTSESTIRELRSRSKVKNQIAGYSKLIMPSTVVVSLAISGTAETQFRT